MKKTTPEKEEMEFAKAMELCEIIDQSIGILMDLLRPFISPAIINEEVAKIAKQERVGLNPAELLVTFTALWSGSYRTVRDYLPKKLIKH